MTATIRKQAERQRRKERGEVALSGWLSASDHAALTQMAREAGMTQAQVIARLIGMRAAVLGLDRYDVWTDPDTDDEEGEQREERSWAGSYVRHSDLTAAVGL